MMPERPRLGAGFVKHPRRASAPRLTRTVTARGHGAVSRRPTSLPFLSSVVVLASSLNLTTDRPGKRFGLRN